MEYRKIGLFVTSFDLMFSEDVEKFSKDKFIIHCYSQILGLFGLDFHCTGLLSFEQVINSTYLGFVSNLISLFLTTHVIELSCILLT